MILLVKMIAVIKSSGKLINAAVSAILCCCFFEFRLILVQVPKYEFMFSVKVDTNWSHVGNVLRSCKVFPKDLK